MPFPGDWREGDYVRTHTLQTAREMFLYATALAF